MSVLYSEEAGSSPASGSICPRCSIRPIASRRGYCVECRRQYDRTWARKNRENRNRLNREWTQRQTSIINSAKSKPCVDCGIQYPSHIMQFDHLSNKSFNIGAVGRKIGLKKLLNEINKCEVVCANCHAHRTFQRLHAAIV